MPPRRVARCHLRALDLRSALPSRQGSIPRRFPLQRIPPSLQGEEGKGLPGYLLHAVEVSEDRRRASSWSRRFVFFLSLSLSRLERGLTCLLHSSQSSSPTLSASLGTDTSTSSLPQVGRRRTSGSTRFEQPSQRRRTGLPNHPPPLLRSSLLAKSLVECPPTPAIFPPASRSPSSRWSNDTRCQTLRRTHSSRLSRPKSSTRNRLPRPPNPPTEDPSHPPSDVDPNPRRSL